jgi:glycosyltransferase involved in cell wall biosynthesis
LSNSVVTPLVSICIPVYNAENTIHETLNSIVQQTYKNLDIVILDNASTDNTIGIIAKFDDSRIRIHRNAINIGGEKNFNLCIQFAKGKYTAIFHADDVYEPEMIELQVAFLEENIKVAAVFTEATLIDESGKNIGKIKTPKELRLPCRLFNFEIIFKTLLRNSNFFICPSVMVRTEVYQQDMRCWRWEMFGSSADLDMWLRIVQRYFIGIIPMQLMRYRISDTQWSARVRLQTECADFFRVIDHYLDQKEVRALLDKNDIQNYVRLERRDRVMRAINLFLIGRAGEAHDLVDDIPSWDALKATHKCKRSAGVFAAGSYLRVLLFFRLYKLGQVTFGFIKRVMRK